MTDLKTKRKTDQEQDTKCSLIHHQYDNYSTDRGYSTRHLKSVCCTLIITVITCELYLPKLVKLLYITGMQDGNKMLRLKI